MKKAISIFVAAATLLHVPAADAADAPEVTPYRPSVSNPAALSAPGRFEVEAGLARERDRGQGTALSSLPYLLKYAFSEDFGILLGGDAYLRQSDGMGGRLSGAGDTSIALKWRRGLDRDSALGLEAGVRLPTARSGLGAGKTDFVVNGIYSATLGEWSADVNLGFTRFGRTAEGEGRADLAWAAGLSRDLDKPWGVALELSGNARRGTTAQSQLLGALTYKLSRSVVLDAGLSRGLNDTVQWTAFAGVAVLFDAR